MKIFWLIPLFFAAGFFVSKLNAKPENLAHPAGYYPGDPLPERTAYLTFDDGPSDWTSMVLDTLDSRNVKATFFICANWQPKSSRDKNSFRKYKDVLVRMIDGGHSVGNHTRSHPNLAKISLPEIEEQLDENQKIFNRELGPRAFPFTLIRPPYGEPWHEGTDKATMEKAGIAIAPRGLMILWSRHFFSGDSMDWVAGDWYEGGPRVDIKNEEFKKRMLSIYNRLIKSVNGGGMIILFHDTHRTSVEILPFIIDKLKELGYKFGTVEDYARWRWGKGSLEIIQEHKQDMMINIINSVPGPLPDPNKKMN